VLEHPQSLTYQQMPSLPIVNKAVTLHCVEGRKEHLLFEGVRLNQDIK
jgi:DMSO/TMAO reductase YedYZ molybdopterin-dependent catalytic subunit